MSSAMVPDVVPDVFHVFSVFVMLVPPVRLVPLVLQTPAKHMSFVTCTHACRGNDFKSGSAGSWALSGASWTISEPSS